MLCECEIVVILKAVCEVRVRNDFSGALSTDISWCINNVNLLAREFKRKDGSTKIISN